MGETVINYTKAINVLTFERYNTDKKYLNLIASWEDNEIRLIDFTKDTFQYLIKDFVLILKDLAEKTFELFSSALRVREGKRGAKNTFTNRLIHIESSLEEIEKFSLVIIVNVQTQQLSEAKILKATLLNSIDKFYSLLKTIGINLMESPLKKDFKKAVKSIKKVNIPKQEHIKNLKKPVEKNETPLRAFFIDKASPQLIWSIQERFKALKGKEMAILIYLLHKKYGLIYLDNNQRNNKSRIHFVRALKGVEIKTIQGINNFFEPITAETTVNEKDEVYLKINKELKEMVSNG
ncbi:hypothetical protein SAMN05444483_11726 [Salegentibacter echinorum]|uniref:Uncharacterized protein n=1 Tax=Salegentibacter echinorum TaxID=1073325 RepID=A0A1M5KZL1_SALEC|nr:hypothetical protein [Salegentibacter echinorum]SHG57949.1 hypothetical protein SAMN05444483_11726 [Salegentibacter echinorum]